MPKTVAIRDLDGLYPPVRELVEEAVQDMQHFLDVRYPGTTWIITETIRSRARQRELYASGRTVPGPILTRTLESLHLLGLAVDGAWKHANGDVVWNWPSDLANYWGHCLRANGMDWGGDWKSPDMPHGQLKGIDKATRDRAATVAHGYWSEGLHPAKDASRSPGHPGPRGREKVIPANGESNG